MKGHYLPPSFRTLPSSLWTWDAHQYRLFQVCEFYSHHERFFRSLPFAFCDFGEDSSWDWAFLLLLSKWICRLFHGWLGKIRLLYNSSSSYQIWYLDSIISRSIQRLRRTVYGHLRRENVEHISFSVLYTSFEPNQEGNDSHFLFFPSFTHFHWMSTRLRLSSRERLPLSRQRLRAISAGFFQSSSIKKIDSLSFIDIWIYLFITIGW